MPPNPQPQPSASVPEAESVAFSPSSLAAIEMSPPEISMVLASSPSKDFVMLIVPWEMVSASSQWMPCLPLATVISPPVISTRSFAAMPFFAAVTVRVPLLIFSSSLETMPWPVSEETVSAPLPLIVRSSFEKIAASTVLSSV